MCQKNIINYLQKQKGRKVDVIELMIACKASRSVINRACTQMAKYREVKITKVKQGPVFKHYFSV